MKVVVIGATGAIGSHVAMLLEERHQVVRASRGGPVRVDLTDAASVESLFDAVPDAEAVVCCAASGVLAPLATASDADLTASVLGKLLGQARLAVTGLRRLPRHGSMVLTGGNFTQGALGSAVGLLVNGGLDAFGHAAQREAPGLAKVTVVHPGWVRETLERLGMDPASGTPARIVAEAYRAALESDMR